MKLVEILARELSEWPVKCKQAEQDRDLEIRFTGGCGTGYDFFSSMATDHATAIVTREMWEAEKYSLFGNCEDMTKEAFNPLQSRDRIYEIDTLVEALEEERAILVQGIEDQGFKLIIGKGVE